MSVPHAPGARRRRQQFEKYRKCRQNASISRSFSLEIVVETGFLGVGVVPAVFPHV